MSSGLLNADKKLHKIYINELFREDESCERRKSLKIKDKSIAMEICFCINNIGLYYSIKQLQVNRKDVFEITLEQEEQNSEVIKIEELKVNKNNYVFDLETDNHHFHAGPGSLIVHNTDSIYVKFNTPENVKEKTSSEEIIKSSLKVGYECAQMLSSLFPKPMELELEKVYYPFFISAKKRYIGDAWEPKDPSDPNSIPDEPERDAKGIVLKRRDNCPFVKKIYGGMIEILMKEHDRKKTVDFIVNSLKDLVSSKVPIEDLIISKTLNSDYKNPESQAHWVLTQKIKKRTPGAEPKSNDRVPYVFVHLDIDLNKKNKGKDLQADKCEDPKWVQSHPNIKIDYGYYIDKQIKKPCLDVLRFVIDPNEAMRIFNTYIDKDKKRNLMTGKLIGGQKRITELW